jgi:hypothetical protein
MDKELAARKPGGAGAKTPTTNECLSDALASDDDRGTAGDEEAVGGAMPLDPAALKLGRRQVLAHHSLVVPVPPFPASVPSWV